MKTIFTLFLSSLFSLSLLAYDGSRLSISTVNDRMDLKIEVDGQRMKMQDNSITLGNLNDGYHNIKIFRDLKRKGNGFGFGRRNEEVIYNSRVFLRRGFHLDITVSRFGKVFTDERKIDRNDDWYEDDDRIYDNRDDRDRPNDDRNYRYNNVMTSGEFNQVKQSLQKEWFENNRITSAKFIIENNNFTTVQVKELMQLFSFDDKKLEIAKLAYRKTVDKQNYYLVNEELTFSSNKEELARFIRESR
jgi:Domain of unknown function (DUF4476)